ncbi:hypothetical protein B484DRAFT_404067, partial [Ochromonadaceae sp. CCMP2298]
VARFHQSHGCIGFLTQQYKLGQGVRDDGYIWWDKDIDAAVGDWQVNVDASGQRTYTKDMQMSDQPPSLSADLIRGAAGGAELPLVQRVVLVREENTLTKHEYYLDFAQKEQEVADLRREWVNANIILKWCRRKLAYKELRRLRLRKRQNSLFRRFFARYVPGFVRWRGFIKAKAAVSIQCVWRGAHRRGEFFAQGGDFQRLQLARAHHRLRYTLWGEWRLYQRRREFRAMQMAASMPVTLADWEGVVQRARKLRQVGAYEEYAYPNTSNITFYRHISTANCVFEKPGRIKELDQISAQLEAQGRGGGATAPQVALAVRLQALWRGYAVRTYSLYVERALEVSMHAEQLYLSQPDKDSHLYNYALHCLVFYQDVPR